KATAYDIPSERIDGQDVLEVREADKKALDHCRAGNGPYFIEAVTYRFRGQSVADPEAYRTTEEVEMWRQEDPILRLRGKLLAEGVATEDELNAIDSELDAQMEEAVRFADESPVPDPSTLTKHVY